MGDAAGYATIGILDKYRDEFEYCIAAQALASSPATSREAVHA